MVTKHHSVKMGTAADWEAGKAKTYTVEFQIGDRFMSSWKSTLRHAHAVKNDAVEGKKIQCQCNGTSTKIDHCLLEVRELDGTYFLAKKRHTGTQHNDTCRFFQLDREKSGLKAYDKVAVDENGGIKVGLGLRMRDDEGLQVKPASSRLMVDGQTSNSKHKTVSLLGLLHLLWDRVGLNYCKPNSIKLRANIAFRLWKQASEIRIKRESFAKHLLMFDMRGKNDITLDYAVKNNRRLFVIAPLTAWVNEGISESGELPIECPAGIPPLRLIDDLWKTTCRSFRRTVDAWSNGAKIIAIAQIEPKQAMKGFGYSCEVVGLALMRVTDYWLPVESSYERDIADELVVSGRRFIKPLRYDAGEDEVFPDFVLLDTNASSGTPMEVFGMTSKEYRERQARKTEYYNQTFGQTGWWSWIPAEEADHKPFPPACL
jgi:hypothetical protein